MPGQSNNNSQDIKALGKSLVDSVQVALLKYTSANRCCGFFQSDRSKQAHNVLQQLLNDITNDAKPETPLTLKNKLAELEKNNGLGKTLNALLTDARKKAIQYEGELLKATENALLKDTATPQPPTLAASVSTNEITDLLQKNHASLAKAEAALQRVETVLNQIEPIPAPTTAPGRR